MTNRLFLDLDGTLIDSKQRQYNLFSELAPESTISFDEYWRCKRNNMNQRQLLQRYLQYSDVQIAEFKGAWMDKIEEPARLGIDVPFEGVREFLSQASREFDLFLVTGRQHLDRLVPQMRKLGLYDYFSDILNTAQRQSKAELIRSRAAWDADDILVGDTGEDILAGRKLGMRTVAVTSGALSEETLRKYHPDIVLESVVHFAHAVLGEK